MFWFDKHQKNTLYIDARSSGPGLSDFSPNFEVTPDEIGDFRALRFPDASFRLVVWDPPHLNRIGKNAEMAKKYGCLGPEWRDDLKKGFKECWRVLMPYGVLIFKWNEQQIKKREVLACFDHTPLFGHPTGSKNLTHWFCFMKIPEGQRYEH
jgi:hypothetical protein